MGYGWLWKRRRRWAPDDLEVEWGVQRRRQMENRMALTRAERAGPGDEGRRSGLAATGSVSSHHSLSCLLRAVSSPARKGSAVTLHPAKIS